MATYNIRKEFSFLWTDPTPNKVVVAGRGLGKTVAAIQWLTDFVLKYPKPSASGVFFASIVAQVTATVVPVMRMLTEDWGDIVQYNKNEHKYIFKLAKNDIREIYLLTYENPESKRGIHPQAIVLDECGSMPIFVYGEIIAPMRTSVDEKLVAIGTARQHTQFHKFYEMGKSAQFPNWVSYRIRASDCDIIPKKLLEERKKDMTTREYNQEYECDFNAKVFEGSVYGELINRFEETNISDAYVWDPALPVWVAWDLGWADYCAMWFFQVEGNEVRFIDFYENNGQYTPFYANILNKKPYTYAAQIMPHDGKTRDMKGASVSEQMRQLGFRCITLPKEESVTAAVSSARELIPRAKFNKTNCELGLTHLRLHKYKINKWTGKKNRNAFEEDEHIHAADAFRYAANSKHIWKNNINTIFIQNIEEYNVLA